MKHRPTSRRRRSSTRSVLRLLDLEQSKTAVLNSLTSQDAQRGYRHAIDEFFDWYCSEPRLAFNRIVVLRYRSHFVNIRHIKEVVPWFKGTYVLKMNDKKQTEIPVSRAQVKRMRELFKI
jgi:LytTr DNA-binding domain